MKLLNDISLILLFLRKVFHQSDAFFRSLYIWSTFKKKPVCTQVEAHGRGADNQANWIVSVAARRYTDLIASGSCDGFVRLWKVAEDYKSITNILSYERVGFRNFSFFYTNI